MVKKKKSSLTKQTHNKPPSGYQPRGSKGAAREKLARASGFRSDTQIAKLFPASNHKLIRVLQQVLAELVKEHPQKAIENSPVALHYAGLIRALVGADQAAVGDAPVTNDQTPSDPADHRARKQSGLAADALRQVVLEAVETPLSMLPSLLADDNLNDREKLKRLVVYTRSLEMLYEPLQLEPIGEPGEKAAFDPRLHESAKDISAGGACLIKRIGFTQGDAVIRKAVVEIEE
jgi:hypothetical protein